MVNDTVRTDNKNEIKLCLSKLSSLLRNKDIIDKMNINQILDDLNLIDITAVNLNVSIVLFMFFIYVSNYYKFI